MPIMQVLHRTIASLALLCVLALPLLAQENGYIQNQNDALALFKRTADLIESTAITVPNLNRTSIPLLENARQMVSLLNQNGKTRNSVFINRLLMNARAYVALADAMEKPHPYPEEATRQFAELRGNIIRLEGHLEGLMERNERIVLSSDRDNLARYANENAQLGPPDRGNPRVVFLGDSITDAWRLNEYFPQRDYINRGISGQVTRQMLGRMQADVINLKPRAIVVLAGTNDIGRNVPVSIIQDNIQMICDLADHHNIKVVLSTLLPVSDYAQERGERFIQTQRRPPARINNLNTFIREFARRRRYPLADYHAAMVDENGFLRASYSDDGLHPNAAGYRLMAPLVFKEIEKVAPWPRSR
jgi:lysophospholipase L1-like esterase